MSIAGNFAHSPLAVSRFTPSSQTSRRLIGMSFRSFGFDLAAAAMSAMSSGAWSEANSSTLCHRPMTKILRTILPFHPSSRWPWLCMTSPTSLWYSASYSSNV